MPLAQWVSESPPDYIRHDHLFKELIHTLFEEFLEAFFPEVDPFVDFRDLTPLSEEVFYLDEADRIKKGKEIGVKSGK